MQFNLLTDICEFDDNRRRSFDSTPSHLMSRNSPLINFRPFHRGSYSPATNYKVSAIVVGHQVLLHPQRLSVRTSLPTTSSPIIAIVPSLLSTLAGLNLTTCWYIAAFFFKLYIIFIIIYFTYYRIIFNVFDGLSNSSRVNASACLGHGAITFNDSILFGIFNLKKILLTEV